MIRWTAKSGLEIQKYIKTVIFNRYYCFRNVKKFHINNFPTVFFSIAVLATLLAVTQGAPQELRRRNYEEYPREAYFNGSAFLKLSSFVSVHRHSGLSFRTCDPGRLFLQKYNDDSISLEVTPEGLLFVAVVDQQRYRARLNARLLNNIWHNVNLLFRLGNLTLNSAGHTQVNTNYSIILIDAYNGKIIKYINKFNINLI